MNKSQLSIVMIAAVLALYWSECSAAPMKIGEEEQENMSSALKQGQELFGGAVPRGGKPRPATLNLGQESPVGKVDKVHSIYTRGFTSLGGGRPNRNDKYRVHNFVPLAPKIDSWNTGEKYNTEFISPEEAAKRWVPHAPYQYTSDEDLH